MAKKTKAAISSSLRVILCIGETLAEREAAKTKEVCEAQLKAVVDVLKEEDWRSVSQSLYMFFFVHSWWLEQQNRYSV